MSQVKVVSKGTKQHLLPDRRNGLSVHLGTWMDLKNIVLSKKKVRSKVVCMQCHLHKIKMLNNKNMNFIKNTNITLHTE